jgi:photosystem II stability/assembly factor-like uncharacterized protein
MKSLRQKVAFLALATLSSSAQEWVPVNPSFSTPGTYDMYRGTLLDRDKGWFIECFPGRIWHTTNGGKHWIKQKDSSDVWANDIVFINGRKGFVPGRRIRDY